MKHSMLFTHPLYLTDGGLETTLIYHQGISLNLFAAFELLNTSEGRKALEEYYLPYFTVAEKFNLPFVLESPTWRASAHWGAQLGYTGDEITAINKRSIGFLRKLAQPFQNALKQIIISGNIGPSDDGYRPQYRLSAEEAKAYHSDQVKAFAIADADVATALTLTYSDEAIGIVNAARQLQLPVVVSFTVETDGKLPGGETLQEAIEATDTATGGYAEHFMINCAHPQHFLLQLQKEGAWKERIRGVRANASLKSHAELDASTSLDAGDRQVLAGGYAQLLALLPGLKVIGGCCGTDHGHMEEVCTALTNGLPG